MSKNVVIVPGYDILGLGIEAYHIKLVNELKKNGYEVYLYDQHKKSMTPSQAIDSLKKFLLKKKIKTSNFISFSFGSYLLFNFIKNEKSSFKFEKVLLVAPLLGGSRLGRLMSMTRMESAPRNSMLYKAVYEDITDEKIPSGIKFGILQGVKKTNKIFPISFISQSLFIGKKNDGFLCEDETTLKKCHGSKNCRHKIIDVDHYSATAHPTVIKEIIFFLKKGEFI